MAFRSMQMSQSFIFSQHELCKSGLANFVPLFLILAIIFSAGRGEGIDFLLMDVIQQ